TGDAGSKLTTQLVVSTHSSHIAHATPFINLRYFRRRPAGVHDRVPTSVVVNLKEVFGTEDATAKFVTRYLKATHSDLFFADGAIFVEGAAERMLLPHFIKNSVALKKLRQSYVTLLEIDGSHAHRLRSLVEHLGLTTLIITDLDSCDPNTKTKCQPDKNAQQLSNNHTLRLWHPGPCVQTNKLTIDRLYALNDDDLIKHYEDHDFKIRVGFQRPVTIHFSRKNIKEALPYTFEDALALENHSTFKELVNPTGMVKEFHEAIKSKRTVHTLCESLFESLKEGDKAKFALDLMYNIDPKKLTIPAYILDGLLWLQQQLDSNHKEIDTSSTSVGNETSSEQTDQENT
ncbi:ATP-dependent nuclease, partial [Magnetococcales bacterium HHB-1]